MKIYISGAIMYASTEQDFFAIAEDMLRSRGHQPVNPKSIPACESGECFKQPHEIEKGMEHSWSCFIKYDLIEMLQCDAIMMLPGWDQSHGARLEFQVAIACGLDRIWPDDAFFIELPEV